MGDMTTALVIEAFLALPHGLPACLHHGRRDRGGQKSRSRRNHYPLLVEVPKVSQGTPLSCKKLVLSPL